MGLFYASITGSTVLQVKHIPKRPERFEGHVVIYLNGTSVEQLETALLRCKGKREKWLNVTKDLMDYEAPGPEWSTALHYWRTQVPNDVREAHEDSIRRILSKPTKLN